MESEDGSSLVETLVDCSVLQSSWSVFGLFKVTGDGDDGSQ